jgi:hypothetical protein
MNYQFNKTFIKSNISLGGGTDPIVTTTSFLHLAAGQSCGENLSSSVSDAGLNLASSSDSVENNDESDEAVIIREGRLDNSNANIYSVSHCPFDWDGILCWPRTLVGETASLPCMETLHGIPYNTSSKSSHL